MHKRMNFVKPAQASHDRHTVSGAGERDSTIWKSWMPKQNKAGRRRAISLTPTAKHSEQPSIPDQFAKGGQHLRQISASTKKFITSAVADTRRGSIFFKSTKPAYRASTPIQHISDRQPDSLAPTNSSFYSIVTEVEISHLPIPLARSTEEIRPRSSNKCKLSNQANSTATIFVDQTISVLDRKIILHCIAKALRQNFKLFIGASPSPFWYDNPEWKILSESQFPLFLENISYEESCKCPNTREIFDFTRYIFKRASFEGEVALVAMVYATRLQDNGLKIIPANWKWIILGCFLLAAKAWDDMAVWAKDLSSLFANVSVDQFNRVECLLLHQLMFNLSVTPREYAQHYFDLRQYMELIDLGRSSEKRAPLDVRTAHRLDAITRRQNEESAWRRWQSCDPPACHHYPLVIS